MVAQTIRIVIAEFLKSKKDKVTIELIPISSTDAFEFQSERVRIGHHIQAGGQRFVHHTNAICCSRTRDKTENNWLTAALILTELI